MTDCAAPRHGGQDEPCILDGGPFHGRIMHATAERIVIPHLPVPIEQVLGPITLPRYRWWHRLLHRPHPFPPDPPAFRNLTYCRTDECRRGAVVYRYEEPA